MRILKKLSQYRRDFRAIYECGHCGATVEDYGYDDANFHHNVIPNMECGKCGRTEPEPSSDPDVPAGVVL